MPSDHWPPRDERQRLTEAHAPQRLRAIPRRGQPQALAQHWALQHWALQHWAFQPCAAPPRPPESPVLQGERALRTLLLCHKPLQCWLTASRAERHSIGRNNAAQRGRRMPKASCQIDEQGGRTGRSTFLATVAARDAAFIAGDAVAGAPKEARRAGRYQADATDMPRRPHRSAQLKAQLFFTATKGRRDPWPTTTTSH